MDLKTPTTFQEQVNKLKQHGMAVDDETEAERILSEINYYRFTGYALQYRKEATKSDYVKGSSFNTVYKIYQFDETLRDVFRKYIEKAEIYYRTLISYTFSLIKCTKPPHDQHYDENNFLNKKGYNEVMDSFKKEKNYYKDSLIVKHHKLMYSGKMPLWVIVELMSFSNTSKLYNSMYPSEKDAISAQVGIGADTLENHLHCLAVLRNKCAHAARLYNTDFNPPAKFTRVFLKKHPEIKNNSLFAYTLVLIKRLPEKDIKNELIKDLSDVIEDYPRVVDLSKIGFPENYKDILKNSIG